MNIDFIEIRNFRKLDSCRIKMGERETIFVGANNSGKTSAMQALIQFLSTESNPFFVHDITLSNWRKIDAIGKQWVIDEEPALDLSEWDAIVPCMDIWLNVGMDEIQFVADFIPTLDWEGGLIGLRLIMEPNLAILNKEYKDSYLSAKKVKDLNLWPVSLIDFLKGKRSIKSLPHFDLKVYILDPSKIESPDPLSGKANMQSTPRNLEAFSRKTLSSLFQVDIIPAQRPLGDNLPNSSQLTHLLQQYYKEHLDLEEMPSTHDIEALSALHEASQIYNKNINKQLESPLSQLANLGYPGIDDPRIVLEAEIALGDSLQHNSTVRHALDKTDDYLALPESFNGLGYQNLISMTFQMMSFRDSWMRVGKMEKRVKSQEKPIPRLHLVLIEEPEAHLHTQVQQVFINNAYELLRKHEYLGDKTTFSTQMLISTHSSYIVMGTTFDNLRYFRKMREAEDSIPTTSVVNMNTVFGDTDKTQRFVSRYIRTTHCDLFFADAVILIEGNSERILLPHFIKQYDILKSSYLSICEIGGSHAFRMRPLIEKLGVPCLIITDIDAMNPMENRKSARPQKGKHLNTSNATLTSWLPGLSTIDELCDLADAKKISPNKTTRVAYQTSVVVSGDESIIPCTFEDSLILRNRNVIAAATQAEGKIEIIRQIVKETNQVKLSEKLFTLIKGEVRADGKRTQGLDKSQFILDLLDIDNFEDLKAPEYIAQGLQWLDTEIGKYRSDTRKSEELFPTEQEVKTCTTPLVK